MQSHGESGKSKFCSWQSVAVEEGRCDDGHMIISESLSRVGLKEMRLFYFLLL